MMIPAWMDVALFELNQFVKEKPGPENSPNIMRYLSYMKDVNLCADSVPWCAAFIEYCLYKAGIKGTGKPNARSYLGWGVKNTRFGAIVILWRDDPEGSLGHVGFKIVQDRDRILLLGGNQSDCVNIQAYPVDRILDQRFPKFNVIHPGGGA